MRQEEVGREEGEKLIYVSLLCCNMKLLKDVRRRIHLVYLELWTDHDLIDMSSPSSPREYLTRFLQYQQCKEMSETADFTQLLTYELYLI